MDMTEVYTQDGTILYHGDARNLNSIPDGSVHLIVTSPPYANAREYSQWESYGAYLEDMDLVMRECFRVLCDGGRIAVNIIEGYGRPGSPDGYYPIGHRFCDILQAVGFALRGVIVWNKGVFILGTSWGSWLSASDPCLRDQHELILVAHKGSAKREPGESTIDSDTFLKATSSIWVIPPVSDSWHPAPFPSEIPRRLIALYSYKGDTVLDPFAGTCVTPFTADSMGRIGIGVEVKREYIERAVGPLFLPRP